mgnify:CR=1 FL=1
MSATLTPKLPLHKDTANDYTHIKEYKELVRQNFKMLMLTIPGERMMDLDFGIGLERFLFEMDQPSLYSRISARIDQQVKKYLPYVEIVDVNFNSGATPDSGLPVNLLAVRVEYIIKPLDTVDVMEISLPGN